VCFYYFAKIGMNCRKANYCGLTIIILFIVFFLWPVIFLGIYIEEYFELRRMYKR